MKVKNMYSREDLAMAKAIVGNLGVGIHAIIVQQGGYYKDKAIWCESMWDGAKSAREAVEFILAGILDASMQITDIDPKDASHEQAPPAPSKSDN